MVRETTIAGAVPVPRPRNCLLSREARRRLRERPGYGVAAAVDLDGFGPVTGLATADPSQQ